MTRHRRTFHSEAGVAMIHMAIFLPMLLLFTGLAVDSGPAYLVKAQLSKAVDGAALSAARNLNGGNPRGEAAKVFNAMAHGSRCYSSRIRSQKPSASATASCC